MDYGRPISMDGCIRLERAANGYTVSMRDPKIVAANASADIRRSGSWKDPDMEYVFSGAKALKDALEFIEKNADKALPATDFDTTFDMITSAGDDATGDGDE